MVGIIDLIGHLSNALFAIGAGFRNVVYFRAILVVAALLEVVYDFYISTFPLWTPIFWGIALILINLYQIFRIIYQNRHHDLSADEQKVFSKIGHSMERRNFKKIMQLGTWQQFEPSKELIVENEDNNQLYFMTEGSAVVTVEGQKVAIIESGSFIGEISFLTNQNPSATVITLGPSKFMVWDRIKLENILEKDENLKKELHAIFSNNIISKLLLQNLNGIY